VGSGHAQKSARINKNERKWLRNLISGGRIDFQRLILYIQRGESRRDQEHPGYPGDAAAQSGSWRIRSMMDRFNEAGVFFVVFLFRDFVDG